MQNSILSEPDAGSKPRLHRPTKRQATRIRRELIEAGENPDDWEIIGVTDQPDADAEITDGPISFGGSWAK